MASSPTTATAGEVPRFTLRDGDKFSAEEICYEIQDGKLQPLPLDSKWLKVTGTISNTDGYTWYWRRLVKGGELHLISDTADEQRNGVVAVYRNIAVHPIVVPKKVEVRPGAFTFA